MRSCARASRRARVWRAVWVGVLLAACGAGQAAASESAEAAATVTYVGEAMCRSCHSVEAEHWDRTIHAGVIHSKRPGAFENRSCEGCHGAGLAHVTNPNDRSLYVAYTREAVNSVETQNSTCLECHRGGMLLYWPGSIHEFRGIACSDCHNPMTATSSRGLLRAESVTETCLGCHPQQRAEFRKRSHMPLFEGKMTCIDCHAPHGSNTEPLIKGDTVNHLCYQCHAEKRGPFIWEHAPVREDCMSCHKPHGSNHRQLLVTTVALLCQQCHSTD